MAQAHDSSRAPRFEPQGQSADPAGVHEPVLLGEVLDALAPLFETSAWLVDGTLGAGGHAKAVLERFANARVLGLDQDDEMLALARARLAPWGARVRTRRARFSQLAEVVREEHLRPVALLVDLGVSSLHLDRPERGFSFQADGPLDMRIDRRRDRTAADLVNHWDEADLADLFFHEGGETRSRAAARAIVQARRRAPFLRTLALAELLARTLPRGAQKIHPATKVFQALRRAVNQEGEELLAWLQDAPQILAPGGRLLAISFHSGEDRVVKRSLRAGGQSGLWRILTKRPIEAGEAELAHNPRARSAKLRVAERLPEGSAGQAAPFEEELDCDEG